MGSDDKKSPGGDPLSGEFKGPAEKERGCTDIIFLLAFIAFWIGMIVVAGLAFDKGDPQRLTKGYDFEGRVCGVDSAVKDQPFVYYPYPLELSYSVCVSNCPSTISGMFCSQEVKQGDITCPQGKFAGEVDSQDSASIAWNCLQNFTNFVQDPVLKDNKTSHLGFCFPTYPTTAVRTRCFPKPPGTSVEASFNGTSSAIEGFEKIYRSGTLAFTNMFSQTVDHWPYILLSAGIAMIVAVFYTQILRVIAGPLAWATLIGLELLFIATAVFCFVKGGQLDPSKIPGTNEKNTQEFKSLANEQQRDMALAAGSVAAVCAIIFFFIIVFLHRRINEAITIIQESSKALVSMPLLMFMPLFQFVMVVILFVYWVVVAVYLASAGSFNNDTKTFQIDQDLRRAMIYHFFGLLWTRSFIVAWGSITFAGAVSAWYFSADKNRVFRSEVLSALWRAIRYHLGTAAFGSFIIAVVEFIRAVFKYYTEKMKEVNKNNPIFKILVCCVDCCLACLQRFLEYASKQAYIQTGMHGTPFCKSAFNAFSLLLRNAGRLVAINVISAIFISIGRVFIAVATAFIGGMLIASRSADGGVTSTSEIDPISTLIILILAFSVARVFMMVYDMTIDTMFQCFCEDMERHGGKFLGGFGKAVNTHQKKDERAKSALGAAQQAQPAQAGESGTSVGAV